MSKLCLGTVQFGMQYGINNYTGQPSEEECFVIGGAAIYKMLLPYTKKMYITKLEEEFEADTFFPEIDKEEWQIVKREKRG